MLVLAASTMALYAVLVAINWKDKPANAATSHLLRDLAAIPEVSDRDNAYVFILGFGAQRDVDPALAGAHRRDWILAQMTAPTFDPSGDPLSHDQDLLSARSEASRALSQACNTASTDCLLALKARPDGFADWLKQERWLRDRYAQLLQYGQWREITPQDVMAPFPSYQIVFEGQRLQLAQAYESARAGRLHEARELAEADARFWLMVLANSDTLISKMIGLRGAQRNMLWTSMTSRQLPPAQMLAVVPQVWLAPLSRQQCSLRRVMTGEWHYSDRFVRLAGNGARLMELLGEDAYAVWKERILWAVQAPLWQRQDASNRLADAYLELGKRLDMDCTAAQKSVPAARATAWGAATAVPWYHPYNLPFNVMTAAGMSDYAEYAGRIADTEAMRRALLVTIELRQRHVPPDQLATVLSTAALRSPFGNKPFEWDSHSGTITFHGLAEDKQGWYHFPY